MLASHVYLVTLPNGAEQNTSVTTAPVSKMLSTQGQNSPQGARTDSGRGQRGRGRVILEEEGPLPTASVAMPPGWGLRRAHQLRVGPPREGSRAPTPGRMHRQLSHHTSFLGCMGRSSFSPAPGRLPGLPQLMVYTLSQSGEHCRPPAAWLQLGFDLQETSVPPRPPQTQKYLAASPDRGEGR